MNMRRFAEIACVLAVVACAVALPAIWWMALTQEPPQNFTFVAFGRGMVLTGSYLIPYVARALLAVAVFSPFVVFDIIRHRRISQAMVYRVAAFASTAIAYTLEDLRYRGFEAVSAAFGSAWFMFVLLTVASFGAAIFVDSLLRGPARSQMPLVTTDAATNRA